MARAFTGSSSLYLTASSSPVSDSPLTMSIWVYPTNLTVDWMGFFVLANSARTQYYEIRTLSYFDYRPMLYAAGSTTASQTIHSSLMSANTWQHLAAVAVSQSERRFYFNGSAATPSFTSIGTTTPTLVDVGAGLWAGSRSRYARAWIAEAAIWDAALSSAEILSLRDRASPFLVRPGSLVSYWPIVGRTSPERRLIGDIDLTVNGSPAAQPHPTIYRPMRLVHPQVKPYIPPSISADSVIQNSLQNSINANSAITKLIQGTIDVDAYIRAVYPITADSVIEAYRSGNVSLDALIAGTSGYEPRFGVSLPGTGLFMV